MGGLRAICELQATTDQVKKPKFNLDFYNEP